MACQDAKNTPFSLEKERDKLARLKNYDDFFSTYSSKINEIEDKNNGNLWDLLNFKSNFKKGQNPMSFHRIKIVAEMIIDNTKILDIGFGPAILEKIIQDSCKKIDLYGIDISKLSVENAKKKFKTFSFKRGSILKIPFGKNSFECVLALEVLEHIKPSNLFKALDEVRRVLRDKGYFIVSVPLNEGLQQLLKEGQNPNAHLREYTPEIIKAELKIMKFKILKEKTLFAFHKNYFIKSFIVNYLVPGLRKPNNIIIIARKK